MKHILPLIAFPLFSLASVADQALSSDPPLPDPSAIRFTPPPPPAEVPPITVFGSTTADFPTHRIEILRGEVSLLPDIPDPQPNPPTTAVRFPARAVDADFNLVITGFTFDKTVSKIDVWNPISKTRHVAWCGWDVSLLAPYRRIEFQGKMRAIQLMVAPLDLSKLRSRIHVFRGYTGAVPDPGAILVPDGDKFVTDLLTTLRDLHSRNLPKLLAIRAATEQRKADATAWHAANPPRPENHTIWLKPHRGSRYLGHDNANHGEGEQ